MDARGLIWLLAYESDSGNGMRRPRTTAKVVTITVILAFSAVGYAEAVDHAALAREFVAKCLADKDVFVSNPPAERNPYKDMSQEEIKQLQDRAMRDGSVLFLYLDGLPYKLISRRDHRDHGVQKTWYRNGRVRSEEYLEDDRLKSGVYLDTSGGTLGGIKEGTGRQILFSETLEGNETNVGGTVDYVDGIKDGNEVIYSDYEKRLKRKETQYRQGKLDGVETAWMSTGEKNSERHYRNGLLHGTSTYWYRNGQVQSIQEYVDGQQVGTWTRFYENGVKAEARSEGSYRRWYSSGQLMMEEIKDESGTVIARKSYDSLGHQNGEVTKGIGSLIDCDDLPRFEHYRLHIYELNKMTRLIQLPRPALSSGSGYGNDSNVVDLRIRFQAPSDVKWAGGTVTVILPDSCKSKGSLRLEVPELRSGFSADLAPLVITLPTSWANWTGQILADVQGSVEGHTVRYQHTLLERTPKKEAPPETSVGRTTSTSKARPLSLGWSGPPPQIKGEPIPTNSKALACWALRDKRWLLYRSPALLLTSSDMGKTWEHARSDFSYRPCGLFFMPSADSLVLWGTKPTRDVNEGIAYVVEESRDLGKSWRPLVIPKVDFLLSIGGNEKACMVSGIRIPKNGIPAGTDWFQLPRTHFMSEDGKAFTELMGPSLFDNERVRTKSIAPNGRFRAFLSVLSLRERTYCLYFSKAADELPVRVGSFSTDGDMVWSSNSRILAVRCDGTFLAYVDTTTGESKSAPPVNTRGGSDKEKADLAEFNQEAATVFKANDQSRE